MQVEVTDEQAELLRELLDIALHELNFEIASADLPSYRESLRQRRTTVQSVLDMVGGPIPNAERFKP